MYRNRPSLNGDWFSLSGNKVAEEADPKAGSESEDEEKKRETAVKKK